MKIRPLVSAVLPGQTFVMEPVCLEPNASGRLWAEDRSRWERLCEPDGCPHCLEQDGELHGVVAETDLVWVSAWPEAPLPGYVCVFSKRHVIEPFDLPEAEQAQFFLDCMAVARGVASAVQPVKMNYEVHGNTVPHLHMHLFPRAPGDVYVGFSNHCRATFRRDEHEIVYLAEAVRQSLGPRLSR